MKSARRLSPQSIAEDALPECGSVGDAGSEEVRGSSDFDVEPTCVPLRPGHCGNSTRQFVPVSKAQFGYLPTTRGRQYRDLCEVVLVIGCAWATTASSTPLPMTCS